ncbi:MAG: hypothetical protein GX033_02615, partial [Firmicutes bacterium]|nr:hypothetical protein [Bacillota bacterium]
MINKQGLYHILDFVLQRMDGYEANVTVEATSEGLTRFGNSEINKNVHEDLVKVTLLCSDGKRRTRVTASTIDKQALSQLIHEAKARLKQMPEQVDNLELVSAPQEISADYFNEELAAALQVEQRAHLIKQALEVITDRNYKGFGSLSHIEFQTVVGNTRGIRRYHRGNSATFTALASCDGGRSPGSTRITSTKLGDLDVQAAMRRAFNKALLNRDQADLDVGSYTIIMEPLAVSDILAFLGAIAFNGPAVQAGSSMLTGKFGQKVFSEKISIRDDWTDSNTLPIPFDLEGAPKRVVPIITKGVAEGVVYDLESAAKAGVETTGHATGPLSWGLVPHNLIMANGEKPLEQMIAETDRGLLVSRFHYVY